MKKSTTRTLCALTLAAVSCGLASPTLAAPRENVAALMRANATAALIRQAAIGAETPERLAERLTDHAGVLSRTDRSAIDAAIAELREDHGADLWVVFVNTFDGMDRATWSRQTAEASALGANQYLLSVAVQDREYFLDRHAEAEVSSSQLESIALNDVQPALANEDWAGAAVAAADGLADTLDPASPIPGLAVGAVIGLGLVGGGLVVARTLHKRKTPHAQDLPGLRNEAGSALVDVDDAIRGARDELGFAEAEFGVDATREFATALTEAEALRDRAFHTHRDLEERQRLGTLTEEDQMEGYREILHLTDDASGLIEENVEEFQTMRDMQSRVESVLDDLSVRLSEVRAQVEGARSILTTLLTRYPREALQSFVNNPDRARAFLDTAAGAIEQGRARVAASDRQTAVVQARLADSALGQAADLLAAVARADEELADARERIPEAIRSLTADLRDADRLLASTTDLAAEREAARAAVAAGRAAQQGGDPVGALTMLTSAEDAIDQALSPYREKAEARERAQRNLAERLERLDAQLRSFESLLHTNRRIVGAQARSLFTHAIDCAEKAHSLAESDPVVAIQHATRGLQLMTSAHQAAQGDLTVDPTRYRRGAAPTDDLLGTLIAGQVLGNVLGGMHGRGGRASGSYGGGGFGGGGFGGGGGFRRRHGRPFLARPSLISFKSLR
ncbi:MAG: TPM domain-containing protein [Bowdeniella nasicola]|nr:TPM domain-containing protein [Bowdeniella nasicola]